MREIKVNNFVWIDLQKPRYTEINNLGKRFGLHPVVIEDFSSPTLRPKAAVYENCLYLAIHIPLFDRSLKTTYPEEVDIAIGEDFIITSHDKEIHQINGLLSGMQNSSIAEKIDIDGSPASLAHYLIETLLETCFPKLDHFSKKLDFIEKQIFEGNEKEMVFEISKLKRDILNFRRTMKPQRSVIESLSTKDYKFISPTLKPYFQELINTNTRIWSGLESVKETIESMEATNNSMLSTKLDLTMKVLTIFSAIMLPLTVYSNFLAMSADIPFGKNAMGFWIHILIALFISLITIFIFRMKKWL